MKRSASLARRHPDESPSDPHRSQRGGPRRAPAAFALAVALAASGIGGRATASPSVPTLASPTATDSSEVFVAVGGSMHAARISRESDGQRVIAGDVAGPLFDEVFANTVAVLADGGVVYLARRGIDTFVVWNGGEAGPYDAPPALAVATDGRAWMAAALLEDGRREGIVNGLRTSPQVQLRQNWGPGATSKSLIFLPPGSLSMYGYESANSKELTVATPTGIHKVPCRNPVAIRDGHVELSPDGSRFAVVDGPQVWIQDRWLSIAPVGSDSKGGLVHARFSDEQKLVCTRVPKGGGRATGDAGLEIVFEDGTRTVAPAGAHGELGRAALVPDGSNLFLPLHSETRCMMLDRGGVMGQIAECRGVDDLFAVGGKPLFRSARGDKVARLVWGAWESPEFKPTFDQEWLRVSTDGDHFLAYLPGVDVFIDGIAQKISGVPVRNVLEESMFEISRNGQLAAVAIASGSSTSPIILHLCGAHTAQLPLPAGASPLTRPSIAGDARAVALAYRASRDVGVLWWREGAEPAKIAVPTEVLCFGEEATPWIAGNRPNPAFGSKGRVWYAPRSERAFFHSSEGGHLAFFVGAPQGATLYLDGRAEGRYDVVGMPRFAESGEFEFLAIRDGVPEAVRVRPGAPAASLELEPDVEPDVELDVGGVVLCADASVLEPSEHRSARHEVVRSKVGRTSELAAPPLFIERTGQPIVQRRADDVGGTTIEFAGVPLVTEARSVRRMLASADGSTLAVVVRFNDGRESIFTRGERFNAGEKDSKFGGVSLSADGRHVAYWTITETKTSGAGGSGNRNRSQATERSMTATLWLDGRQVFQRSDGFTTSRGNYREGESLAELMIRNGGDPAIAVDGSKVASLVELRTRARGNEPEIGVVIGETLQRVEELEGSGLQQPVWIDRPTGRFSAFVGNGNRWVWSEGGLRSREFPSTAKHAICPVSGRFAVAAPALYDSGSPLGLDRAARASSVDANLGPVFSRDGSRIATVESAADPKLSSLFVDGREIASGVAFVRPCFSDDSRRIIAGFRSPQFLRLGSFGNPDRLPIGRLLVDDRVFQFEGMPVEAGWSRCGRLHWCVAMREGDRRSQFEVSNYVQMLVNGVPGPEFNAVGCFASNDEGTLFAYVAADRSNRAFLVVNHEIVTELGSGNWFREDTSDSRVQGIVKWARPSFPDASTVCIYDEQHGELRRVMVKLEGGVPPAPGPDDARSILAPVDAKGDGTGRDKGARGRAGDAGDPADGEEEGADREDGDEEDGDEASGEFGDGSGMIDVDAIRKAMEEAQRRLPGAQGGGRGVPSVDRLPANRSLPGKPAKSGETARFHGVWKVRLADDDGQQFDDVLTIRSNGTIQSDHAIDFELEPTSFEVRNVDGVLELHATARDSHARFVWKLTMRDDGINVDLRKEVGGIAERLRGRATIGK